MDVNVVHVLCNKMYILGYKELTLPHSHPYCLQLHDSTDSNEEQVRIYRALGAGKTEALSKKCLEFAISVSLEYHLMYNS